MKTACILFAIILVSFNLKAQNQIFDQDFNRHIPGFYARDILVQPDGKILAVGNRNSPEDMPEFLFTVARLNENGTLDSDFGEEGIATFPMGTQGLAWKVGLQSDGKIILAGSVSESFVEGLPIVIAFLRLNVDGSIDTDFGEDGRLFLKAISGSIAEFIITHNDEIIFAGSDKSSFSLFKLKADGEMDSSFGDNGSLKFSIEDDAVNEVFVEGAELQSDEKIIIAGNATSVFNTNNYMVIARVNTDGTVDREFNKGSFRINRSGSLKALTIQEDDKILIGGNYGSNHSRSAQIIRLLPDGDLDKSFANNGVILDLPDDHLNVLVLRPDGKILVGMEEFIFRFNQDGSVDYEFEDEAYTNLQPRKIIVLPDLKLLVLTARYNLMRLFENVIIDAKYRIRKIVLIDAVKDIELREIYYGDIIDLNTYNIQEINIRAYTFPEIIGSVTFNLREMQKGSQILEHIENVEPYALYKNDGNNFFGWKPILGSYVLKATPHSEGHGKGEMGEPLELYFSLIRLNEKPAQVSKVVLINAETNEELFELKPNIPEPINLNNIGTKLINFRAYTNPSIVSNVSFQLRSTDLTYGHTEFVEPYALFKNDGLNYFEWRAIPGDYELWISPRKNPEIEPGDNIYEYYYYFSIIEENDDEDTGILKMYPNPGYNLLNIRIARSDNNDFKIKIFDLAGNEVLSQSNLKLEKNILSLDVSGLKSKPYLIKLISNNEVKHFRWIKN